LFRNVVQKRELGVVVKAKPVGMLWMMPAGWLNHLPGAAWLALGTPSQGRLMGRTNKFTLLDDSLRGFGGAAAGGGSVSLAEGSTSLGYVTPAAFAATCLA